MLRMLQWLLFGHIHHWKTLHFGDVVEHEGGPKCGRWYDQECTKCGKRRNYQS